MKIYSSHEREDRKAGLTLAGFFIGFCFVLMVISRVI